jgi:MFS family permease
LPNDLYPKPTPVAHGVLSGEVPGASEPGEAYPFEAGPEKASERVRRARLGVAALFFVNGTTVGSWVPHIPDRAHQLGLNSAQLGAALLAGGLGCVAAMPLSGWLTRRFGSRQVSTVAGLLFPALLALAIIAPTTSLLVASLVLVGMAGASMDVAMNAHGVLVEKHLGRRTISLLHGLFSAGGVAGSAITAAALARHIAPHTIAFSIAATLAAVVLIARAVLLRDAPDPHGKTTADASAARGGPRAPLLERVRARLPHGRLLLLGVLTFSTMVSEGAVGDWSALLLRVTRGLGDGVVGYGYTCFSAAMVLGRFTGDRVVARLGEVNALRLGGLLGVLGLGGMLLSPTLPLMLVGFAVAGLGLANASPILYRAAGRLPGFDPSAAIAVAVGVGYAGLLAGPPALGFVAHIAGLRSIFYILMVLCAVLALAATLVRGAAQAADQNGKPTILSGDPVSADPVI